LLGVSWDGAGYGLDKTIWGGEFLLFNNQSVTRTAHLKKFRLPGGESSFREIKKSVFGVLYEIYGNDIVDLDIESFTKKEAKLYLQMLKNNINSPECSSAGRLFDAVASILNIERNDFKNNLNLGMNPQIKKELDIILNAFLNFHLERELKSQKVMNKLEAAVQL